MTKNPDNLLKKIIFSIALSLFSLFSVFSQKKSENIRLMEKSEELGITLYWDTFSSSGLLEKGGHHISFQNESPVIMLDSKAFRMTDAPQVIDGNLTVSQNFIDDANNFFKDESSNNSFKIGAILLDPGHGGKDPGAMATYTVNGKKVVVREKDITLSVGKMLYAKLKSAYPDKQIILTRDTDKFLALSERTEIANSVKLPENEAVLFISIHVNASLNKEVSGYEVWYLTPGYRRTVIDKSKVEEDKSLFPILNSMMEEEYTTESILIAKFIMDGLQSQIGNQSKARGIKAEEWFVVRNSNMPSVLIEVGFLTNEKEGLNLNTQAYLQKTSLGIYNGISAFVTHFERSRGFIQTK